MMRKVLEKFKNKKVFALYLVGVLLLSTGISFAYFSASSSVTGEGSVATGTTATIESKGITANGNIEFNNVDIYPGHTAIASIEVIGTGDNEPLMYNVIFNGTNTFNSPLNYTVYKSESNIEASYTCTNKNDYISGGKTYYEECVGNNIESLGSPISSGTLNNGSGKTILKSDEIMLTIPEGEVVYYYIVIEYPNLDINQNDDMGSSISGNITIEEGSEYQKPSISMIGSTVSGSNNWYTSASIITNITTQTGNYEAYYCTTTDNSCTPDIQANISNNSFTTTLSSNTSPQKVCARVVDEYNQTTEGCSDAYYIDGILPTSNVTIASSTAGSNSWYQALTFSVSGSDAHSGVSLVKYCTTTSSSCTPSTTVNGSNTNVTLSSNASAQRICAQAVDNAGNTSSTTCSSAYSVDTVNPTVSITSTSVTENSISVTVSGSDAHSGIYQYRFSNNGGSSYTTVTTSNNSYTYTFTGLNSGTSYNIAAQSVDRSGRISSTVTRSVTTDKLTAAQTILANSTVHTGIPDFSQVATTDEGVWTAEDNLGTSYYFRGAVTNNYVQFAGYYWRIIRINGDGTIRMIYQGASATATGEGAQIQTSTFNSSSNNNMYVGYMYQSNQVHGLTSNSIIKGVLDAWYQRNLLGVADKIDGNVGFCGDRTPSSGTGLGGRMTVYAAYNRVTNKVPTFKCENDSDLYTTSGSTNGNKALTYPIGLITADEVSMAGGVYGQSNNSYYLDTGQGSWTMTPYTYTYGAIVFYFGSFIGCDFTTNTAYGVRPVINLKADVTLTGSGTMTDPYVVN